MWLFLKNLLFTIFVPGVVGVWVPLRFFVRPLAMPETWTWRQLVAMPLLVAGVAIYARCVWDFAFTGRGTPAPIDAPKVLVAKGLYRHVRNPMYLGVLSVILGEAIFFGAMAVAGYALVVALFFHLFVLLVEEPGLRRQFGESYERYTLAVHRWWPGRAWHDES